VCVVDGATHSQKDGVESGRSSLKKVAEILFVPFLRDAQQVLRSSAHRTLCR